MGRLVVASKEVWFGYRQDLCFSSLRMMNSERSAALNVNKNMSLTVVVKKTKRIYPFSERLLLTYSIVGGIWHSSYPLEVILVA